MALAALIALDSALPGGFIPGDDDLAQARTMAFTTLVLAQLFNVFNIRSETRSAFSGLFSNSWLWLAVGASAVLQVLVVHLPVLNIAFGTVPLTPQRWLLCAAMASAVLWLGEGAKFAKRWRNAK